MQLYSRDMPSRETAAFPSRSSHPSVSALIRREKRSPSVERSNASSSSRGSPYHSMIPPHRPRRTRPEPHQLVALQKLYNRTSNPSIEERGALALEVGMYVFILLDKGTLTHPLFRQGPCQSNELVPQPTPDHSQACPEAQRGGGYGKYTIGIRLRIPRGHSVGGILLFCWHTRSRSCTRSGA